MDQLSITSLAVPSRIGIYDWEQRILQTLVIDVEIPLPSLDDSDSLEATVDYSAVCQLIEDYLSQNSFRLIETVALSLADVLKKTFHLKEISLSVSKPKAIKNAANVKISIRR